MQHKLQGADRLSAYIRVRVTLGDRNLKVNWGALGKRNRDLDARRSQYSRILNLDFVKPECYVCCIKWCRFDDLYMGRSESHGMTSNGLDYL